MKMSVFIDHHGTHTVICPYCGYDAGFEDLEDKGTLECENEECKKHFNYYADYEVSYSTYEVKDA